MQWGPVTVSVEIYACTMLQQHAGNVKMSLSYCHSQRNPYRTLPRMHIVRVNGNKPLCQIVEVRCCRIIQRRGCGFRLAFRDVLHRWCPNLDLRITKSRLKNVVCQIIVPCVRVSMTRHPGHDRPNNERRGRPTDSSSATLVNVLV